MTTSPSRGLIPESRYIWRAANPGHRYQLVCFPYAGASATAYSDWVDLLSDEIELIAIQLPGRQNRIAERPFSETGPLVSAVFHALGPVLDSEVAFFGHSCGALLAFETARLLQARGRRGPEHLFLSAQSPPCVPHQKMLHELPDAEFKEAIQALGGVAAELAADEVIFNDLLPLVRADFGLWERHQSRPGPPLSCRITALGGRSDPVAPPHAIEQWHRYTTAGFTVRAYPGGHFYHLDTTAELVGYLGERMLSGAKVRTAS